MSHKCIWHKFCNCQTLKKIVLTNTDERTTGKMISESALLKAIATTKFVESLLVYIYEERMVCQPVSATIFSSCRISTEIKGESKVKAIDQLGLKTRAGLFKARLS